jgi:hypothetical protein
MTGIVFSSSIDLAFAVVSISVGLQRHFIYPGSNRLGNAEKDKACLVGLPTRLHSLQQPLMAERSPLDIRSYEI